MRTVIGTILLLLLVTATTHATPEQIFEETSMNGDVRLTRTLTSGADIGSAPLPGNEQPLSGQDGTVLWVDQVHLNGIPSHTAISGDGHYVVGGWWLNNARVALYDAIGSGVPSWTFLITTSFFVPVDASDTGGLITGTGRQDQLHAWDAASSTPFCSLDQPVGHEGYVAITPDGGGLFAGSAYFPGGDTKTQGNDDTCDELFSADLTAAVQGGRFAAGGDWIAVNSRTQIQVYNATTGALRGTVPIAGETQATVGISGDGNILAIGGFSRMTRAYEWNGNSYVLRWGHTIPGVTWITAVDVSDDGSTVMVGTVLLSGAYEGRVVMYDMATGPTPLWTCAEFGDQVNSVALSADGSVGLAGSWGRYLGTYGHLVAAWRRDDPAPFFTVEDDELPGVASVYSVDISNDGTVGCAGGKAVHAREMGHGGYAMAFELPGPASVEPGGAAATALTLALRQNVPNPFNPSTSIGFVLDRVDHVQLTIHDAGGRTVRHLADGRYPTGIHQLLWDGRADSGREASTGVYFYRLEVGDWVRTRKMQMIR